MASHTTSELREAARVLAGCVLEATREAPRLGVTMPEGGAERGRVFDGLRDAA
jgi:hypothetical protein